MIQKELNWNPGLILSSVLSLPWFKLNTSKHAACVSHSLRWDCEQNSLFFAGWLQEAPLKKLLRDDYLWLPVSAMRAISSSSQPDVRESSAAAASKYIRVQKNPNEIVFWWKHKPRPQLLLLRMLLPPSHGGHALNIGSWQKRDIVHKTETQSPLALFRLIVAAPGQ